MRNTPISSLGFSLLFIHQFSLFSHRYSCYHCFSILHYFLYFLYFLVKSSRHFLQGISHHSREKSSKENRLCSQYSFFFKRKRIFPNPQESNIATVPIAYTLSVPRFVSRYTVCYHRSLAIPFSILPSPPWQHTGALFVVHATDLFPLCPCDFMETRKKKKKEKRKKKRQ